MHQLPSFVWNQIAAETDLETEAARLTFSLESDQDLVDVMANWGEAEVKAGTLPWMVASLQEVLPLMMEHEALTQFRRMYPEFLAALPEVPDAPTAVALMSSDGQWSQEQSLIFSELLQSGQPQTRWLQSAKRLALSAKNSKPTVP